MYFGYEIKKDGHNYEIIYACHLLWKRLSEQNQTSEYPKLKQEMFDKLKDYFHDDSINFKYLDHITQNMSLIVCYCRSSLNGLDTRIQAREMFFEMDDKLKKILCISSEEDLRELAASSRIIRGYLPDEPFAIEIMFSIKRLWEVLNENGKSNAYFSERDALFEKFEAYIKNLGYDNVKLEVLRKISRKPKFIRQVTTQMELALSGIFNPKIGGIFDILEEQLKRIKSSN